MSTRPAKVVYPLPPPTANTLNDEQRQRLVKRSRKIEQILGEVPHVLDVNDPLGPISITLPSASSRAKRGSCEIVRSSAATNTSALRRSSSFSSISSASSGSSSDSGSSFESPKRKGSARSSNDCWLDDRKAPLLAVNGSDFASTKDSRPVTTAQPHCLSPPINRPEAPDFASLLSPKKQQKRKMDRLRKTLGAGIPMELVFGKERADVGRPSTDRDAAVQAGLLTTSSKLRFSPSRLQTKRKHRKLSRARDSLSGDSDQIHKAARRWQRLGSPSLWLSSPTPASSESQSSCRRSASTPPPIPTTLIAQPTSRCTRKQNALNRGKTVQYRLSRIAECPEDLTYHEIPTSTPSSSQDLVVRITATVHYDSKTYYKSERDEVQNDRPLSWSWRKPVPLLTSELSD